MNLASVDLNLLVALDALIAEAHVGRAARKIGRSQPAVSHALRRLRDLLGDPLLIRIRSRIHADADRIEVLPYQAAVVCFERQARRTHTP
jgi:DNA-binding transcriptional LysR family regulator